MRVQEVRKGFLEEAVLELTLERLGFGLMENRVEGSYKPHQQSTKGGCEQDDYNKQENLLD